MTNTPGTLWERTLAALSGSRLMVRGAAMPAEDQMRGAVTITVRVPTGLHRVMEEDGSGVATLILNPDEARGLAEWLSSAAAIADEAGPPLY